MRKEANQFRCVFLRILTVAPASSVFAFAGERPFHSPAEAGPFRVGFRELTFTDSVRGRVLKTAIWYPATAEDNRAEGIHEDAPPDVS